MLIAHHNKFVDWPLHALLPELLVTPLYPVLHSTSHAAVV